MIIGPSMGVVPNQLQGLQILSGIKTGVNLVTFELANNNLDIINPFDGETMPEIYVNGTNGVLSLDILDDNHINVFFNNPVDPGQTWAITDKYVGLAAGYEWYPLATDVVLAS